MSRHRNDLRYVYAPWVKDETLYPVGYLVDDQLVLKYYRRREFPASVYSSKYNTVFLNQQYTGWRCFVSGAQCYYIRDTNGISIRKIPFVASVDHLVPLRDYHINENCLAHRLRNQTICGGFLNKNIGHIPLALKILHRQVLQTLDYDRENPTLETFWTIKTKIIETEEQLFHLGKFPWQAWTYSEADRPSTDAFNADMARVDAEFLAIEDHTARREYIDGFRWRW
jgi:hypothetical protein